MIDFLSLWFSQTCFFYLLLSSDRIIFFKVTFCPLGKSNGADLSVFIDFYSDLKGDAPFHCATRNFFHADWNGLRDQQKVFHWRISLNVVLLLLFRNFVIRTRL